MRRSRATSTGKAERGQARQNGESFMKTGRLTRALTGIKFSARTGRLADGRLAPRIMRVRPGSAAERAGLKPGDHLVKAAGLRMRRAADFRRIMNRGVPPFVLPVLVRRDGAELRARLRIRQPRALTPAASRKAAPQQ